MPFNTTNENIRHAYIRRTVSPLKYGYERKRKNEKREKVSIVQALWKFGGCHSGFGGSDYLLRRGDVPACPQHRGRGAGKAYPCARTGGESADGAGRLHTPSDASGALYHVGCGGPEKQNTARRPQPRR